MSDPLQAPADNVLIRAQREVDILWRLKSGPMTLKQIQSATNLNMSTVKSIVQALNAAEVTERRSRFIRLT